MKSNIKKSYYLVKYCGGSYDDYYNTVIFVTDNKSTATKYVAKFNRILKKWKKYYEPFEDDRLGFRWMQENYIEKYFDRWYSLRNITKCYYEEIPFR